MKILDHVKNKGTTVCSRCGKKVDDDMLFCPYCGCELKKDDLIVPEEEDNENEGFDASLFMHESDRKALKALKAIPGFTPLLKSFMSIWNERQFRIENLSGSIRLSEKQMPKYYNMLPPICEKLGIAVPELYLTLDVVPNAWTSGDTNPFITITSGLIETIPDELIPTVLAHECGHIACHHVLYQTMGRMLMDATALGASFLPLGLGKYLSIPLQMAFYYWMRCSELSADRAAAYYDGGSEKLVEMCMRFAGFDKDIPEEASKELFMQQAVEYKEMVDNNKWDKTLEFLILQSQTHPFVSSRAYECNEWTKTDEFKNLISNK